MNKKSQISAYVLFGIVILLLLIIIYFQFFGVPYRGKEDYVEEPKSFSGNVAVIPIKGQIVSDRIFPDEYVAASSDIAALIEKADKDSSIKIIVLEINSDGGSGFAALEIANALKQTSKTKVAWIRESGASAAYFLASYADHIIADKISYVGSIGVILDYEIQNVSHEVVKAGRYKDIFNQYRPLTEEERKILQQDIDYQHQIFIEEVAKNRKMQKNEVEKIANGLSYNGIQAKELGLIDEIGGKAEVLNYIKQKQDIEPVFAYYNSATGLFDLEEPSQSSCSTNQQPHPNNPIPLKTP